ncbi:hypothetical protein MG296_00815 [Flavobacteriaceae bacterium TK19130]|nr:hypothetical protein [Thermobacterium salinum]
MKPTHLLLPFIFILSLASCKENKDTDVVQDAVEEVSETVADARTPAEKIAMANGIEAWDDVTSLRFTFNVDRGENHYERSWIWYPKQNEVIKKVEGDENDIRYNRNDIDSTLTDTDAAFINDSYWLLAPYKLKWDEGVQFSKPKKTEAPISKDQLWKITATYGDEGGYTPGDAYDFFYDDDYRIREWVYRKANADEPSMMTTWEGYKTMKGLILSTSHKNEDGNFHLYFSDIAIQK